MAEDHRFHKPEGHRLCANSCGFFGSPATLNLCSKCYHSQSNEPAIPTRVTAKQVTLRTEPVQPVMVEAGSSRTNRCNTCRKRVGLTGFKCRCGVTCCGTHRYAEQHDCTWDYKGAGKEAITRENPMVKAEKVAKI